LSIVVDIYCLDLIFISWGRLANYVLYIYLYMSACASEETSLRHSRREFHIGLKPSTAALTGSLQFPKGQNHSMKSF